MPDALPLSAVPGLGQIDDRLAALRVPAAAFDPAGDWSQTYTILAGDGGAAHGRLTLTRQAKSPGATLLVDWRKGAGGPTHWRVSGTVRTTGDAAGGAVGGELFWQSDSARHAGFYDAPGDAAGRAIPATRVAYDGRFVRNAVRIDSGSRVLPTEHRNVDAVIVGWQAFDLVQRLPRRAGGAWAFTLVDQFEAVKPKQTLLYAGPFRVPVGGGDRDLHRFDLTGFATVPATFWVDDATGRLLAAVSGLEAYVLGELPRGGGRDPTGGRAKRRGPEPL